MVCQGSAGSSPSRRATSVDQSLGPVTGELDDRGAGAGGATDLGGEAERAQVVAGVEHALEPLRGLEPEGDRYGVLGQGASDHQVVTVPPRQGDEGGHGGVEGAEQVVPGLRGHQHECRVQHVLAGQPPVQPGGRIARPAVVRAVVSCAAVFRAAVVRATVVRPALGGGALAQQREQGYDGVAAGLRAGGDPREVGRSDAVRVLDEGSEVGPGRGRCDPVVDQAVEPALLHLDHGEQEARVVVQPSGALVAGPEEVGHHAPG